MTVYVRGLLSDVQRKNVEAIALDQDVKPRILQRFLESIKWDHDEALVRCQKRFSRYRVNTRWLLPSISNKLDILCFRARVTR